MFEKEYDHNTGGLVFAALSNIFKPQIVIHNKESQRTPECSETAIGGVLQLYCKRDSGTHVFLWILQNF